MKKLCSLPTNFRKLCFLLVLSIYYLNLSAQGVWDDKSQGLWPIEAQKTWISSSMDHEMQAIYYFKSVGERPQPLIISLHTWSGDYRQRDPLISYCIAHNINYIHPDFRGPNNNPKAGGSAYAIQDIDDAISWALNNLAVDVRDIHVVGVSGGAFATLLTYMKSKHSIKSFSAFVGIYNLEDWYYESLGRGTPYATHISLLTTNSTDAINFEEARRRSPYFMKTPIALRKESCLNFYCGIDDGYTGSVPITQTLEMYNKVVDDFGVTDEGAFLKQEDIYTLLKRRTLSGFAVIEKAFMGRDIIYQNSIFPGVTVRVFKGGHEMPEGDFIQEILKK